MREARVTDFGPFYQRDHDAEDGKTYIMRDEYEHRLRGVWPEGRSYLYEDRADRTALCVHVEQNELVIYDHFRWNGPSGPTVDTTSSIRASCVHDALYAMMKARKLPLRYRGAADREFRLILREDGMNWLRRWYWWMAVRLFAGGHAKP